MKIKRRRHRSRRGYSNVHRFSFVRFRRHYGQIILIVSVMLSLCICAIITVSVFIASKDDDTNINGVEDNTDVLYNMPLSTFFFEEDKLPKEPEIDTSNHVTFIDSNIETAVREYLNNPDMPVVFEDFETITRLEIYGNDIRINSDDKISAKISMKSGKAIMTIDNKTTAAGEMTDISDLQYFTSLEYLRVWNNKVSDLTPISNLTNLTYLSLALNEIVDISPLASLTSLQYLDLWRNQVEDLSPLKSLINLETFTALGNKIKNISVLSNLIKLKKVDLSNNNISDWSAVNHVNNVIGKPKPVTPPKEEEKPPVVDPPVTEPDPKPVDPDPVEPEPPPVDPDPVDPEPPPVDPDPVDPNLPTPGEGE